MPRRAVIEESENHERWLISYADFITLLLAFFVVMYSISQVNESKYRVLSNTLTEAFNAPELSEDPLQVGQLAKSNPLNVIEFEPGPQPGKDEGKEKQRQQEDFEALADQLESSLGELTAVGLANIKGNEQWLEVELNSSLLFESGQAVLTTDAEILLNNIAQVLFDYDKPIRVEGFTDSIPISTPRFPSNWELSASRAAAVVQMFAESGLDPKRMAAVGYGQYQPKADNSTPEGRAANRRVVLMIAKADSLRPSVVDDRPKPKAATPDTPQGQDLATGEPTQVEEQTEKPPAAVPAEEEIRNQLDEGKSQGVKAYRLREGGLLFSTEDRSFEESQ